jgi:hypothetical protein
MPSVPNRAHRAQPGTSDWRDGANIPGTIASKSKPWLIAISMASRFLGQAMGWQVASAGAPDFGKVASTMSRCPKVSRCDATVAWPLIPSLAIAVDLNREHG